MRTLGIVPFVRIDLGQSFTLWPLPDWAVFQRILERRELFERFSKSLISYVRVVGADRFAFVSHKRLGDCMRYSGRLTAVCRSEWKLNLLGFRGPRWPRPVLVCVIGDRSPASTNNAINSAESALVRPSLLERTQ